MRTCVASAPTHRDDLRAQLVAVPSIIILAKFGLGPNVELAAVQYGRGMQQEAVIFYYCER